MKTKLSIPVMLDSIVLSIPSKAFANYIGQRYLSKANIRRVKLIEQKFGVKYVFDDVFPPDILWNDYGERLDFLPKENDVIVDVGANIGDWSIVVGKHYRARVIAVEPSPRPFELLLKNIRINGLHEHVIAINCALFSEDKEISVYIDDSSGYAFLRRQDQLASRVLAKTLDGLLKELDVSRVDLIKIDTEGFEHEVLKGAMKTISKLKPRIIVEVHSEELRKAVIACLLKNEYVLVHEKINFFYDPHLSITSILYLSPQ